MRYDRPFSTYCLHLLGRRLSSYPLCYLQQSRPPHRRLRLKLAGSSNKKGPSSSSCSLPGPRQGQSGSSKLAPVPSKRICLSWNRGRGAFPGTCNLQHICISCRGQHPAQECTHTALDSNFFQPQHPQPPAPPATAGQ